MANRLIRIAASDSDADYSSLESAITHAENVGILKIEDEIDMNDDIVLPAGVKLVFGECGLLTGAGTVTGHDATISADPFSRIFGSEITLDGRWNAVFSPIWFGAVYDGLTDCTAAIQKCLDQRGEVRLRGTGTALISDSLVISGGTWLHLDPSFTVWLADNACCTMLRTIWADQRYFEDEFPDFAADPDFPRYAGPNDRPGDWVLGEPEENIKITGGIWDSNGGKNPRQSYRWGSFGFRGHLMQIVNVRGFVLRDTKLYDPDAYFFEAAVLCGFTIENIMLDMRELRPNQDGIHLEGECYNGVISNIYGRTWDDMVALNGGDSAYPKFPPGVDKPEKGTGTNRLWTPFLQGKIKHVVIRDIHVCHGMTGYRAVRLLSTGRHQMDEITIDGIYGKYHVNAVLISSHYESSAPYGTIIVRNLACTVEGSPETEEHKRQGHIWLENQHVAVDTLIINGCSYEKNPYNGRFLENGGRIKRLFIDNVNITVAKGTPSLGRGMFCSGPGALVNEAYFSNMSLNNEEGVRCDIAVQGRWERIKMVNCLVSADTAFDFHGDKETSVQEINNECI